MIHLWNLRIICPAAIMISDARWLITFVTNPIFHPPPEFFTPPSLASPVTLSGVDITIASIFRKGKIQLITLQRHEVSEPPMATTYREPMSYGTLDADDETYSNSQLLRLGRSRCSRPRKKPDVSLLSTYAKFVRTVLV
jgi:hypothetical protein